jgi:hypothetical protein
LIVDVVICPHVEELVWLEEHVLAVENCESYNNRDGDDETEEDVAEWLFGSVDDKKRCSEKGEEDVGLHHPKPGHACLAVELQTAEHKPDLIYH